MKTAIMYIAERCNQDCVFCLEVDGSWTPFVDPTTRQVVDEIGRLKSRGADQITFMGGETFFRKDLPQIISHAKSIGFKRIGVVTNGTVLSKKGFISTLTQAGLDFMEFSVHGHTPELANAIARTHYSFERQSDALDEVNETGGPLTIVNVVICRENKDHLIEVADYVSRKLANVPHRFKFKFVSVTGLAANQQASGEGITYEEVNTDALGDFLEARGIPFWFYNFPLCRLGRHAAHSHEAAAMGADETYFDFDHRGGDGYYDSGNQIEGRVWPASTCGGCTLRAICPGLEDTYRRQSGAGSLSTRTEAPLEVLRGAIAHRAGDPSKAPARLALLSQAPRPTVAVIERREKNWLRFTHPGEAHPLDLWIVELAPGRRAFIEAARFGLSYEPWEDNPRMLLRPAIVAQLEAAGHALEKADAAGLSLTAVVEAVRAAIAPGWSFAPPPEASSVSAAVVPLGRGRFTPPELRPQA